MPSDTLNRMGIEIRKETAQARLKAIGDNSPVVPVNVAKWLKIAVNNDSYTTAKAECPKAINHRKTITKELGRKDKTGKRFRVSLKALIEKGLISCPKCKGINFSIEMHSIDCLKCREVIPKAVIRHQPITFLPKDISKGKSFALGLGIYGRLLKQSELFNSKEYRQKTESFSFDKKDRILVRLLRLPYGDREYRINRSDIAQPSPKAILSKRAGDKDIYCPLSNKVWKTKAQYLNSRENKDISWFWGNEKAKDI